MGDAIQLEPGWSEIARTRGLVPEGEYTVVVERLDRLEDRVRGEFQILDEGPHCAWTLYESFNLDSYAAKFYEFVQACGVNEEATEVHPALLRRKVLEVTVKHRKDEDGKTWANISRFAPPAR